jgi:hypothetical protein
MINKKELLIHYSSVNYNIGNEKRQIGTLSDNQLFVSHRILSNKPKLTPKEQQQLDAIKFMSNHRAEYSLSKQLEEVTELQNTRLIGKAVKQAEIIEKWILKSYK